MSKDMNPAAEAAREVHRNKTSGRFEEHHHPEAPLSLAQPLSPAEVKRRNLEAVAAEQSAALVQAKRAMNAACCAVAAHNLSEEGLDVGKVLIEGDDKYWFVCAAETPDGDKLDGAATLRIKDAMHEAGVQYETTLRTEGIDLSRAQHWTPEDDTRPAPDEDEEPATGPAASAARARIALATLGHQDATESMMLDMLTNLRHLAREEGIDFDDRVDASFEHFQEEMDDYEQAEEDRKNA